MKDDITSARAGLAACRFSTAFFDDTPNTLVAALRSFWTWVLLATYGTYASFLYNDIAIRSLDAFISHSIFNLVYGLVVTYFIYLLTNKNFRHLFFRIIVITNYIIIPIYAIDIVSLIAKESGFFWWLFTASMSHFYFSVVTIFCLNAILHYSLLKATLLIGFLSFVISPISNLLAFRWIGE